MIPDHPKKLINTLPLRMSQVTRRTISGHPKTRARDDSGHPKRCLWSPEGCLWSPEGMTNYVSDHPKDIKNGKVWSPDEVDNHEESHFWPPDKVDQVCL